MSNDSSNLPQDAPFRDWPLISVIVATHKRASLLPRALDSVLAQTFKDIEVWCVHDGEPDPDTIKVWEDYAVKFEEAGIDFFPIATDEHTGYYCLPRNTATENSRGVYIANLDDDNEWQPTALADLMEGMEEGEAWPDLVYGRRKYVLDPSAPKEFEGKPLIEGDSPFVPFSEEAKLGLAISPSYNFIDSSDFLVSKGMLYRLAVETGMVWNEGRRRFGDHELVTRLAWFTDCKFKGIDKIVQIYHVHKGCVSLNRPAVETPKEKILG